MGCVLPTVRVYTGVVTLNRAVQSIESVQHDCHHLPGLAYHNGILCLNRQHWCTYQKALLSSPLESLNGVQHDWIGLLMIT